MLLEDYKLPISTVTDWSINIDCRLFTKEELTRQSQLKIDIWFYNTLEHYNI